MTTLTLPVHHHMPFGETLLRRLKHVLQDKEPVGLFFESNSDNALFQTNAFFLKSPQDVWSVGESAACPDRRLALCDVSVQLHPHLVLYMHGRGNIAVSAHGLISYAFRSMGSGAAKPEARVLCNARAHIFETSHHARLAFQKEVRPLLEACAGQENCESFTTIALDFQI